MGGDRKVRHGEIAESSLAFHYARFFEVLAGVRNVTIYEARRLTEQISAQKVRKVTAAKRNKSG